MATYNLLKIQQQKLAEQQAELERQIAAIAAQEKASALERIRELMASFGITAAELAPKGKPGRKPGKAGTAGGKARVAGTRTGKATYRDPATGATWSGLGRRPGWIKDWLAQGRALDDLAG